MRILLDESLNIRLKRSFPEEHDVWTVRDMRWLSYRNGRLLDLARDQFDALVTADHSIPDQQNITADDVRIVVLRAFSNSLEDHEPMVPDVLEALESMRRGEVREVYSRDFLST